MNRIQMTIDAQSILAERKNRDFDYGDNPVVITLPGATLELTLTNVHEDKSGEIHDLKCQIENQRWEIYHYAATVKRLNGNIADLQKQYSEMHEKYISPVRKHTDADEVKKAALAHLPLNKINAIKAVREVTCSGLKEAKDYVDALCADPESNPPIPGGIAPVPAGQTTAA